MRPSVRGILQDKKNRKLTANAWARCVAGDNLSVVLDGRKLSVFDCP
jgi:hypothetical protein